MTIELDYAFLADYAAVVEGKLTAVGASFTEMHTAAFPVAFPIAIAGRFRASEDVREVRFEVEIVPPEKAYEFKAEGVMNVVEPVRPYNGKLGVLFAFNTQIPIVVAGLYVVNIHVDGKPVRRLAFEAGV